MIMWCSNWIQVALYMMPEKKIGPDSAGQGRGWGLIKRQKEGRMQCEREWHYNGLLCSSPDPRWQVQTSGFRHQQPSHQGGHQAQAEPPRSHQQPRPELEKEGTGGKVILRTWANSLSSEIELGQLSNGSNYLEAQRIKVSSLLIILARFLLWSFARVDL